MRVSPPVTPPIPCPAPEDWLNLFSDREMRNCKINLTFEGEKMDVQDVRRKEESLIRISGFYKSVEIFR